MKKKTFNIQNGFTLLEVIAAISILAVGLGGTFCLIQQTLSVASVVKSKLIATYLAQEGIEMARNIRDTNWLEQRVATTTWNDDLVDCYPCCEGDYKTDTSSDVNLTSLIECDHDHLRYLNIDDDGFYSYSTVTSAVSTKFKRKISVGTETDKAEVSVRVEWKERGRIHAIRVLENMTDWYGR